MMHLAGRLVCKNETVAQSIVAGRTSPFGILDSGYRRAPSV